VNLLFFVCRNGVTCILVVSACTLRGVACTFVILAGTLVIVACTLADRIAAYSSTSLYRSGRKFDRVREDGRG
jgi:hypothetical protein